MHTRMQVNPVTEEKMIVVSMDDLTQSLTFQKAVMEQIILNVADRYVQENYAEIVSLLDQKAIANMAVATAAAAVNKTLGEKIPNKILRVEEVRVDKQVFQRGIFGGMTRIR